MGVLTAVNIIRLMFVIIAITLGLVDEFVEHRYGLYKHAVDTIYRKIIRILTINLSTNEPLMDDKIGDITGHEENINRIGEEFRSMAENFYQDGSDRTRLKEVLEGTYPIINRNYHPYGTLLHQFVYLRDIAIMSLTDLLVVYLTYVWFVGVKVLGNFETIENHVVIETHILTMIGLLLASVASLFMAYHSLYRGNEPFNWMTKGISLGILKVKPRVIRTVTLLFFSLAPPLLSETIPIIELTYEATLLIVALSAIVAVLAMDLPIFRRNEE